MLLKDNIYEPIYSLSPHTKGRVVVKFFGMKDKNTPDPIKIIIPRIFA